MGHGDDDRSGLLSHFDRAFEKAAVHDHLCLIYENPRESAAAAASSIRTGLRRREKSLYISDDAGFATFLNALREEGLDIHSAIRSKMLLVIEQDAYFHSGTFDPDRLISALREATDTALAEGFPAVRVTGDITPRLVEKIGFEPLIHYESKANLFFSRHPASALCRYNLHDFEPQVILDAIRTHPRVMVGPYLRENPYYIPPERFLGRKQAPDETECLLHYLSRRRSDAGRSSDSEKMVLELREKIEAGRRVEEELKKKLADAEASNGMKSNIVSMVSHELRTPLNAIIGYTLLLKDPILGQNAGKRSDMLERIYQNGRELLEVINALLDLRKIEAGRMTIEPEKISISDLLWQVLIDLKPLWGAKNLTVKMISDSTAPSIRSDPKKIRRIFTNLIANAIKFTDKGSIIVSIFNDAEGKKIKIEIRDTGIGIEEEQLIHIFEPFYQADPTNKRSSSGTGLGLAIVKEFLALIGGEIDVKSKPGSGSIFTLILPYNISP